MSLTTAHATRAASDLRYGMGRQATTSRQCAGCPKRLRRSSEAAIWLCARCKRTIERAYSARLRSQGIAPDLSDRRWLHAWADLRQALYGGNRALIAALLAEGR